MAHEAGRPIRVFFFGDSICFGQGVSLHKGWVTRISAALGELSTELNREILLVNTSVNGNTTRQALERMPYDVQSHNPDVVIVQFGMNDCNYWRTDAGQPRVSLGAFVANLLEIVDRAAAFGSRRIILNTNHPTGRNSETMPFTGLTYQQSNEIYNQAIREAAAQRPGLVRLVDVEHHARQAIGDDPAKLLELILPAPDLLHLSEKGHDLYFGLMLPVVREAVEDVLRAEGA